MDWLSHISYSDSWIVKYLEACVDFDEDTTRRLTTRASREFQIKIKGRTNQRSKHIYLVKRLDKLLGIAWRILKNDPICFLFATKNLVPWCSFAKGYQFHFDRCFILLIEMEYFSFGVFWRAVSRLYCSYIYIYIYIFNKHNSNSR